MGEFNRPAQHAVLTPTSCGVNIQKTNDGLNTLNSIETNSVFKKYEGLKTKSHQDKLAGNNPGIS